MAVFVAFLTLAFVQNITASRCEWYNLSMPYGGRYCPGVGAVTPDLLPHQCRYLCLQSVTCKACNYKATVKTCTRFTLPCPQVFSDPDMALMVLRETPINQCYEWVLYNHGDPADQRMIQTANYWYFVSRLKVYGNDVVCYFNSVSNTCWATLAGVEYSTRQGHQCERLRPMWTSARCGRLHHHLGISHSWGTFTAQCGHRRCPGKWRCALCGEVWLLHCQDYLGQYRWLLCRGRYSCNQWPQRNTICNQHDDDGRALIRTFPIERWNLLDDNY